jgi:hypothetical protein
MTTSWLHAAMSYLYVESTDVRSTRHRWASAAVAR